MKLSEISVEKFLPEYLLGIAPCTAMVLVWGFLAKGNDGHIGYGSNKFS